MVSALERLKTKRDENLRDKSQQISAPQIDLRGTGLTKRIAERDAKAYERETERAMRDDNSLFKSEAESAFEHAIAETIDAIREEQKVSGIEYDESQLRALAGMLQNQFCVLIGAAGTGKTTLEKKFIEELSKRVEVIDLRAARFRTIEGPDGRPLRVREDVANNSKKEEYPAIACCAYTGRATQQMKRALPEMWHKSTTTIHSLLGYAPVFEEVLDFDPVTKRNFMRERRVFRPSFGVECKLPYKVIIMDESSMTPIPLWNELIDALTPDVRIILIGDINQLPPVYGKSILGYAMRHWPVFELTTIHRQAANNAIIANAHRCLQGKPLENASNFHILGAGINGAAPSPPGQAEMSVYVRKVIKALHDKKLYDPFRDAIIVPQNKGMIGTNELNSHFVHMFNAERSENGTIVNKRIRIHTGTEERHFAVGDKVMINSNINNVDPPITNGMLGFIETINQNGKYDMKRAPDNLMASDDIDLDEPLDLDTDKMAIDFALADEKEEKKSEESEDQRQSSHVMTIKFDNGQTYSASTAGDYRRIIHGYVQTCHKSQGGEYPNVIIVCHSANSVMLSREWLYTALTRARLNVYLIGNARGIRQALQRQVIKGHNLQEKIRSYVIETKSDDDTDVVDRTKHPVLWKPRKLEWKGGNGADNHED